MSKLYTYIVQKDTGLAPNPFWGYCTLAVCTPNHQGSRVMPGDWIAGFLAKEHGHKFLYAMEVSERVHMDDYFRDKRFAEKKPRIRGTAMQPMQQCGDNFYSLDDHSNWRQHPNLYHVGMLETDTRKPWVFVAKRFWYLGLVAHSLPDQLRPLVGGRGARCTHPENLVQAFKEWVGSNFSEGITAMPRDFASAGCHIKSASRPVRSICGC